jgi:transposase
VRKVLYKATLRTVRFRPAARVTYRRLKEKGKPEKVARVAAARKLLLISHTLCTARGSLIGPLRPQVVDKYTL